MEEECVFCRIAEGKIPAKIVWENKNFLAFLDINPYVKGHLLVIPRKHYKWVWDINDKEYTEYMKVVKDLANILRDIFNTEWVEEVIAGVGVSHAHIHLLPRKENDGIGEIPIKPLNPKPSEKEMNEIAEEIKHNIKMSLAEI